MSFPVYNILLYGLIFFSLQTGTFGETWCGKNYKKYQPVVPPLGAYHAREPLKHGPELAFRCHPRIQPYIEGENCENAASILVDVFMTSTHLPYSASLPPGFDHSTATNMTLTVDIGRYHAMFSDIVLEKTTVELPISLCGLQPHKEPYDISCTLVVSPDTDRAYDFNSKLSYLPSPVEGSVTKFDRKTRSLMTSVNLATEFRPIFPIGFYTDFEYIVSDLSVLDKIKEQGFNMLHPVPPFGEESGSLEKVLERMDELGLYLVYDMRHTYQDLESVSHQINALKHHKCLLLWYTADEPDGPGHPLNATLTAYNHIYDLDGYHPVSIALNCADHFFEEYVNGADVILPDVYPIGIDPQYSTKYETECNRNFGCCGCDNCEGRFEDISKRLVDTNERLKALGWDQTKMIWAVPQAFGGEEFWARAPTGREFLAQVILSINHGARGIMPWIDPTPSDIKQYASRFAKILPRLTPYFFNENVVFNHLNLKRVDIGIWKVGSTTLILAVNLDEDNPADSLLKLDDNDQSLDWVLKEGVSRSLTGALSFEPLGSAVVISSLIDEDSAPKHDEL